MQQPKGIAVVLGVLLGLVVVGTVVGGVLFFRGEFKSQIATTPAKGGSASGGNTNAALQLTCNSDADCISYCGGDPNYQPTCGVSTIGGAGSCTCRSTTGVTVTTGNTNVRVNMNATVNANSSAPGGAGSGTAGNTNSTVSTTSWKLYTNTDFGYTIKYPSDWPIEPQNTSIKSVVTIGNTPAEPSAGPFGVYVKKNDADLTAFLSSYKRGFPDGCLTDKQTTVNGVTWTEVNCTEAFAGQTKKSYQLTKNGSIYQLYYIEGSATINATFQLILSTFTFTK
ncbi:MAG: hypothetical protein AAB424_01965 [Patescibacteria group bacterium]